MTSDEAEQIVRLLETKAREAYDQWHDRENGVEAATQLSIAVSLQRIATALERFASASVTPTPRPPTLTSISLR